MVGGILTVLLIILFLLDSRKTECGLSSDNTALLKGGAALLVLIHHIAGVTDGGVLNKMNFPSVSIFFLLAGYGLMCGYLYKENYIKKILQIKIPIIIVWCVFSALCATIFNLLIHEPISVRDVLLCFTGNRILNWFFASLILHYLMFALSVKLAKQNANRVCILTFVFICVYMVAFRVLVKRTSWYASSLAFPTGVFIAYHYTMHKDSFSGICRSKGKAILLVLFLGSFSGVFLSEMTLKARLIRLLCSLISAEVFSLFGLLICCDKKSNGILSWCGKNSAQILFMQNISLYAFRNRLVWIESDFLFSVCVILIEFLLVFITEPVYKKLKSMCERNAII